MHPYQTYLNTHFDRFIAELQEWLSIPSVSANPAHHADVARAAEWAAAQLKRVGLSQVSVIETATRPLVYAEWLGAPGKPTVLCYGHFDVQPPEPLEEWTTPPFAPAIREGNLYARGAADDKGQVMLVLKALEILQQVNGTFPVNLKVLLEGEEETTGEAIAAYVQSHANALAADAVLICDTHMPAADCPVLMTGLRGMLYTELTIHGAAQDLHSGLYGGVAPNPLHALAIVIGRLKDADGTILVNGLADLLPANSAAEVAFWQADPLNLAASYQTEMGVTSLVGPAAMPPLQRVMAAPTLEVHGIKGGFVGEGSKTVIPAAATAKISMRLPGGLDPAKVYPLLEQAVQQALPVGYHLHLKLLAAGEGVAVDPDNVAIRAASAALENVYQKPVHLIRSGGSIPVATLFQQVLKTPVVLMGFGLPDDRLHAPNEKFSLTQFRQGILTVIDFLKRYAEAF